MTTVERDPRNYPRAIRSGPAVDNDQPPILLRLPNVLPSQKSVDPAGKSLRQDEASSLPPPIGDVGPKASRKLTLAKEAKSAPEPPALNSRRESSIASEDLSSRTRPAPISAKFSQERSFAERFGSRVTLIILMLAFGLATLIALKGQKPGPVLPADADDLALELALGDSVVEGGSRGSHQEPTPRLASDQPAENLAEDVPNIDFSKPSSADVAAVDMTTSSAQTAEIDLNSPSEANLFQPSETIVINKMPPGDSSNLTDTSVEKSDDFQGALNFDLPTRQLATTQQPSSVREQPASDLGSRSDSGPYPQTPYPNRVRWIQLHPEFAAPEARARVAEVPSQPASIPGYSPAASNSRGVAGGNSSNPTREPPSSYLSTPYQGTGNNPWGNYQPSNANGTMSR